MVEISCFLWAYQQLAKKRLSSAECDQYVVEMNEIGCRLGAINLPPQWMDTQKKIDTFRRDLVFDARAKEVLHVSKSSFDILPSWTRDSFCNRLCRMKRRKF